MVNALYAKLNETSPMAVIIIAIALMLLGGYLMTRITKKLKLPNVTAYIITGIIFGPYCLDLIPQTIIDESEFLADIALAFIAFSTGEFFKLHKLKKNMGKVLTITLFESLLASIFVFILTYFILDLDLAFAIVLAALASATAPASTMMTIRQTKAKGDFVDTLLQVVAYDDVVALLAYSIAISIATSSLLGSSLSIKNIIFPVFKNISVLLLGGLFGLIMKIMIQNRHSNDNRLIISVALLFTFCGICASIGVSPLLGCMSMGTVYINTTDDDKLFKQLNYFNPPILLLFFVRSGLSFDLNALFKPTGGLGNVSLLTIGIAYFFVRIIGKYSGAYLGCKLAGKSKDVTRYFGLGLIPQAGVAIGLAALGSRILGGTMGNALETVILSSSVLYELIGPACAKFALYRSHSYSNKLEDLVPVVENDVADQAKTPVELLIDRINIIQAELKSESISEEEAAFNDAAEENNANLSGLL